MKHEDTNLASSTLIPEQSTKENLGIIVQYKVSVYIVRHKVIVYRVIPYFYRSGIRDEDPGFAKKTGSGLCTSNEERFLKVF